VRLETIRASLVSRFDISVREKESCWTRSRFRDFREATSDWREAIVGGRKVDLDGYVGFTGGGGLVG
jgi:hypothetical protein